MVASIIPSRYTPQCHQAQAHLSEGMAVQTLLWVYLMVASTIISRSTPQVSSTSTSSPVWGHGSPDDTVGGASRDLLHWDPLQTHYLPWPLDGALGVALSTLAHGVVAPCIHLIVWEHWRSNSSWCYFCCIIARKYLFSSLSNLKWY